MALKATIYKAQLNVADVDRGYYADHALTLACHPSETEERLMVRLFAFALFAGEHLAFTSGLCADDEPDLWEKDLTGDILHWIEIGQPDESRIRKACHRARQVTVVCFGANSPEPWWAKNRAALARFDNLTVLRMPAGASAALAAMAARGMALQVTIQDGSALVSAEGHSAEIRPECWQEPAGS